MYEKLNFKEEFEAGVVDATRDIERKGIEYAKNLVDGQDANDPYVQGYLSVVNNQNQTEVTETEAKTWRVSCSNDMDDGFGYSAGPMVVYDGLTKAEAKSIARGKNREMFRLGLAGEVTYFAEDENELAEAWEHSMYKGD